MTIASVMNAPETVDHAALAESMPLDEIDVSNPALYQQDVWQPYFRRLRREAPVHHCRTSPLGPYWSVTKHKDIIALEVDHRRFSSSSAFGGITLRDRPAELELPMFIAMDPPKHDVQRKVVQPIVSPENLANFEGLIRTRVRDMLDHLPRGETFNWVDKVSVELTCQMLATLFDFPFEDRRKLGYWSDVSTAIPYQGGLVESEEQKEEIFARAHIPRGFAMRQHGNEIAARFGIDALVPQIHEITEALAKDRLLLLLAFDQPANTRDRGRHVRPVAELPPVFEREVE